MDTKKSPSNLGLSFAGVNCLVVFPTHLNPNNFLFYITSNFTPIHVYPCLNLNCKLEPAIWSHDNGQLIPCFDRCQLTVTWMSNIKGCYKPRVHVSVKLLAGVWSPSYVTPLSLSL